MRAGQGATDGRACAVRLDYPPTNPVSAKKPRGSDAPCLASRLIWRWCWAGSRPASTSVVGGDQEPVVPLRPLHLLVSQTNDRTSHDAFSRLLTLTDGSGAVVDRYSYDLWGEVKLAAGVRCARCCRRPNRGCGGRPWPNVRWRIRVY